MRYMKKIGVTPINVDGGKIVDSLNTTDDHATNAPSIRVLEESVGSVKNNISAGFIQATSQSDCETKFQDIFDSMQNNEVRVYDFYANYENTIWGGVSHQPVTVERFNSTHFRVVGMSSFTDGIYNIVSPETTLSWKWKVLPKVDNNLLFGGLIAEMYANYPVWQVTKLSGGGSYYFAETVGFNVTGVFTGRLKSASFTAPDAFKSSTNLNPNYTYTLSVLYAIHNGDLHSATKKKAVLKGIRNDSSSAGLVVANESGTKITIYALNNNVEFMIEKTQANVLTIIGVKLELGDVDSPFLLCDKDNGITYQALVCADRVATAKCNTLYGGIVDGLIKTRVVSISSFTVEAGGSEVVQVSGSMAEYNLLGVISVNTGIAGIGVGSFGVSGNRANFVFYNLTNSSITVNSCSVTLLYVKVS